MMGFDGGWLGPLIMLGLLVGVVLVVVWAVNAGGRRTEDDALDQLRVRFARGEIDADRFEEMKRTLGGEDGRRTGANVGLIGLVLIVAAIVLGTLIGSVMAGGWGGMPGGWGGMPGGGGMMGIGAGPTAPADTSVRMAGSRFEPSTLTIESGETVRWFTTTMPCRTPSRRITAHGTRAIWRRGRASSAASTSPGRSHACAATTPARPARSRSRDTAGRRHDRSQSAREISPA